ncbi:Hypothetical predicted protein [Paramuricea clavata]|uniref:Uncharacterized protein n=1 Tax=Paramuricea clavata TaxID=317549 RepID=A0A7D9EVS4_PARCT|nr:Hypothetical predicted protein [Paramuricea clavata]
MSFFNFLSRRLVFEKSILKSKIRLNLTQNVYNDRIRAQDKLESPAGIPNHIFAFPENYAATTESIDLSDDDIQDVAEVSGVMDEEHIVNFIDQNTKQQCVGLIPNPEKIEANNAIEAY